MPAPERPPCNPHRFTRDRRFTRLHAPALRDAICVVCGKKELRYLDPEDSLDDYALTVARFAKKDA